MGLLDRAAGALGFERRSNPERITSGATAADWHAFWTGAGAGSVDLPNVTIESALTVPAFASAVLFLPRTLAALPLHAFNRTEAGATRISGGLQSIVHDAPNPETSSFEFRRQFWQALFLQGRGLAWIEKGSNGQVMALWPMDPNRTSIVRRGGVKSYIYDGRQEYAASEVVDLPFMPKPDGLGTRAPFQMAAKAIQIALAQGGFAANWFAGGGMPPLALEGPLAEGAGARQRQAADIARTIDQAKSSERPFFAMPPGYKFTPVGFEPEKAQMTEARRFQIQEIARVFNLPPVFLADLTNGTFSNTEQQDLYFVKHLVGQWAFAFEQELNLKITGPRTNGKYVEHNLDGLMRGDFKTRMEGLARGVQTAILTPNEARALENRPKHENGTADDLFIQGATVPLGTQPTVAPPVDPNATSNT